MSTVSCSTALHLRRLALLPTYEGRAPRYTSYPTAVQFTPAIGPAVYAQWLRALPPAEPISAYVHIPFCARLCWFCGCNTRVVKRGEAISDYVALLLEELAIVEANLPGKLRVGALHLGGGTPNMLSLDDMAALFGGLRQVFRLGVDAEIAAELDPIQLTSQWVRAAAFHGLTRASLGVQDLSPRVQAAVNRREPFEVVARAAGWLREAGVRSLNLDLMYGLPLQRKSDVLATLDSVLTLSPERIALFGYAHVPWMKTHQKLIDSAQLPGTAERLEQSEYAAERLIAEGYVQIGLDHFAREDDDLAVALRQGTLRRNFQGYTSDPHATLLAFGASAIGRLPQGLVQNETAELAWRKAVSAGAPPTARGLAFTDEDGFRGEIIERLMCDFAVDLAAVRARHDRPAEALAEATARLRDAIDHGVIQLAGERLTVTELGRPFVRQVAAAFDAYISPGASRHSSAV
jgi:oxygen-independent coproporphyrinogen-3 oxidase